MANNKRDEDLEKLYKELRNQDSSEENRNALLSFFIGLLMLGGGLFMIFNNLTVTSSWGGYGGHFFHIGSFSLPNGMIMFPIIVGIGMLFAMKKKIFGWIVLATGVVIVLLSVLSSTHLVWRSTNGYVFVIMFGLVAAGAGLVIKALFGKR